MEAAALPASHLHILFSVPSASVPSADAILESRHHKSNGGVKAFQRPFALSGARYTPVHPHKSNLIPFCFAGSPEGALAGSGSDGESAWEEAASPKELPQVCRPALDSAWESVACFRLSVKGGPQVPGCSWRNSKPILFWLTWHAAFIPNGRPDR